MVYLAVRTLIYFGAALIMPNASTIAMRNAVDKSHSAAVMSFINMGVATLVVLSLNIFSVNKLLLPTIYLIACGLLIRMNYSYSENTKKDREN